MSLQNELLKKISNESVSPVNITLTKEVLVASYASLGDTFADMGGEVDLRGYNNMNIWCTLDVNDSSDIRLKLLSKHTAGGTQEYTFPHQDIVCADTTVPSTEDYLSFTTAADALYQIKVPTLNNIPYVQVQAMAASLTSTCGAITGLYVTKGY